MTRGKKKLKTSSIGIKQEKNAVSLLVLVPDVMQNNQRGESSRCRPASLPLGWFQQGSVPTTPVGTDPATDPRRSVSAETESAGR